MRDASPIPVVQMLIRLDVQVFPCADVRPAAIATLRPSKPVRICALTKSGETASLLAAGSYHHLSQILGFVAVTSSAWRVARTR